MGCQYGVVGYVTVALDSPRRDPCSTLRETTYAVNEGTGEASEELLGLGVRRGLAVLGVVVLVATSSQLGAW